ncbi:uncharacterized protein LOC108670254 [Hyalella azteca]|uniref:Uncharacterized protein LOC108670254 n=1 Tax=Hyalella azteca TaxID=294128 RepID=A0A8B7NHU4_HYAAZ|nr:uncharacterized protein LOC108670254 [Hyalella azteca]
MANFTCHKSMTSKPEGAMTTNKISVLTSLHKCDDHISSLKTLIQKNLREMSILQEKKKKFEESREKLCEQQPKLQEQLQKTIEAIAKSETECFNLKKKLPYLSREAILDNIKHLELQLRLHNYRPREEELMLKEITKLQDSVPLLEEYRTCVQQNRKHRNDRVKLVSQRNAGYDTLQTLLPKIDALAVLLAKEQISLQENRSGLEEVQKHKLSLLEVAQRQLEKRERRKADAERRKSKKPALKPASADPEPLPVTPRRLVAIERDVYGPQLDACHRLLPYCRSLVPPSLTSDLAPDHPSLSSQCKETKLPSHSSNFSSSQEDGKFYSKPQEIEEFASTRPKSLQHLKKRARNKNKMNIKHPPDVIGLFMDLGINVPRYTVDIPAVLVDIEQKLNYFELLNEQLYLNAVKAAKAHGDEVDIVHVISNKNQIPKKKNKHFVSGFMQNEEIGGQNDNTDGFRSHKTYNIYESDLEIDPLEAKSPMRLYSSVAKTPLTPMMKSSDSEFEGGQKSDVQDSDSNTIQAETLKPSSTTDQIASCLESPQDFVTNHSDENGTRIKENFCIVPTIDLPQDGIADHPELEGQALPSAVACVSKSTERRTITEEDCESGVFENEPKCKPNSSKISHNEQDKLSSDPNGFQKSENKTSGTRACEIINENYIDFPNIVVDQVVVSPAEHFVPIDQSCSSVSSSSSGCSCAGSSSSASTKSLSPAFTAPRDLSLNTDPIEKQLPLTSDHLLLGYDSIGVCHASSSLQVGDTEALKMHQLQSKPRPTSLDLSSSHNSVHCNRERISISSSSKLGQSTILPKNLKSPSNNRNVDNKNSDTVSTKETEAMSGFCALSPLQAAAIGSVSTNSSASYASITSKNF